MVICLLWGVTSLLKIGAILKYDGLTKERSLLANANPEIQLPISILYAAQPVPYTLPPLPLESIP